MITKPVEFYIDLWPGWQDQKDLYLVISQQNYLSQLTEGNRRIKVIVQLPCFGGSAAATDATTAKVEEVKP